MSVVIYTLWNIYIYIPFADIKGVNPGYKKLRLSTTSFDVVS